MNKLLDKFKIIYTVANQELLFLAIFKHLNLKHI